MATPAPVKAPSAEMEYIWKAFRGWDEKAVQLKSGITRWRSIVLSLTIVGTLIATLSQQLKGISSIAPWMTTGLGVASGICLALAGFFTKELLKPAKQSEQVRTRAAAEGLRAEAYLLAAGVPPYDDPTADHLDKARKIKTAVKDLTPATLTDAQQVEGILAEGLSVDQYIQARVEDQRGWYTSQVGKNEAKVQKAQMITLGLGALGVVLTALAALFSWVAGWVAVIGTVVAAILAYQYAGRYQFLVVTYRATADRLNDLKTDWQIQVKKGNQGKAEHDKFILACEEVLATENSAWMAEWTKPEVKP